MKQTTSLMLFTILTLSPSPMLRQTEQVYVNAYKFAPTSCATLTWKLIARSLLVDLNPGMPHQMPFVQVPFLKIYGRSKK